LPKYQEIICKEKVMNSRVVFGNPKTFNVTKACFSEHQSGEHFRSQDKKERGKRIPLSQSSGKRDYTKRASINEDGKRRRRGDAGFNPTNSSIIKTQLLHDGWQKLPFHLIKYFLHVHFEKHKALFAFLILESMYELMSKDGVVLNIPARHKSILERIDYLRENFLQSVGKTFGNDFVRDIA
jgi:hypothetical protein